MLKLFQINYYYISATVLTGSGMSTSYGTNNVDHSHTYMFFTYIHNNAVEKISFMLNIRHKNDSTMAFF